MIYPKRIGAGGGGVVGALCIWADGAVDRVESSLRAQKKGIDNA